MEKSTTKIITEKDGSFTINCNEGEVTMSTRSFGMVGKSYKTASEAFKDATWSTAIERPLENEYSPFWALLGVLLALGCIAYVGFTRF
jgi:hypothetical protein